MVPANSWPIFGVLATETFKTFKTFIEWLGPGIEEQDLHFAYYSIGWVRGEPQNEVPGLNLSSTGA
jgi:hypothetical protein